MFYLDFLRAFPREYDSMIKAFAAPAPATAPALVFLAADLLCAVLLSLGSVWLVFMDATDAPLWL